MITSRDERRTNRSHEALAQAIELEERVIVAVKCMECKEMVSAYGFNNHECRKDSSNGKARNSVSRL